MATAPSCLADPSRPGYSCATVLRQAPAPFLLLVIGALTLGATGAGRGVAYAAPAGPLGGYCSPTGDYCVSAIAKGQTATFSIVLAARYFGRYQLCVTPPRGSRTCKSFPIRKVARRFLSTVRWEGNYPNRGAGVYRAVWSTPSGFRTSAVGFRITAPPEPPPPPAVGTRANPIPFGSVALLGDGWRLAVVSSTPNANEAVAARNQFNDPPAQGRQFYIARIRATYTGGSSASFDGSYRLRAVGRAAVSYSTFADTCGVIPDEIPSATVFPGGTVEGNVCWSVRTSDVDSLVMYDDTSRKFFSLR